MRMRQLRIRVQTDCGLYGVDITFPNGLVVLWADNSMGKTTCVHAALVALGLEAMLTTSQQDLPLPPAMKSELDTEDGIASVIQSEVYLEIENGKKDRIVVQRTIKGSRDKNLITVTHGPALTQPSPSYVSQDFFVSREGAASREQGFHWFLATFLGWQLPEVQTFDGRWYPLYLQCIFPYVLVDQMRGWASLEPSVPVQFRIREPNRRVVEFLLDLDAYRIAAKRNEISEEERRIETQWATAIREIRAVAKGVGGMVHRLPAEPVAFWPPEVQPAMVIPEEEKWLSVEDVLTRERERLKLVVEQELPRVKEVAASVEMELRTAQGLLCEREAVLVRLLERLQLEKGEIASTEDRLEKIEEDLQRNKDVKILVTLGSTAAPNTARGACPACHQAIADSLMPLASGQAVMSIDENIEFLEEQRRTFKAVLSNAETVVAAHERQVARLREEMANLRSQIRALQETLVADGRLPSKAAIRKQVESEEWIARLKMALAGFYEKMEECADLAAKWSDVQKQKLLLPKGDASEADRFKLKQWQDIFCEQLKQYDFRSIPADSVTLSMDTYRPTHEGFDLPTNISASDFIRVIWSYLTGLLELGRKATTLHPGMLLFDEPKQQSTKDLSFGQLLKRASQAGEFGQQIIFATSENRTNLNRSLDGLAHTYIEIQGRVLKKLPN